MDFGNNLRNLRVQRKITQQKLADDLDLAQSTIGAYETNEREPSFKTIKTISDYFGVSPYMLLPFESENENDSIARIGEIVLNSQKLKELFEMVQTYDDSKLDVLLTVARSMK